MARLIALTMFNYPSGTRTRLNPGDEFEAGRDAKALMDVGLAKPATYQTVRATAKPSFGNESSSTSPPGLTTLRHQYEEAAGHPPDMRWGTERLRREIETARMHYQRRDLRAED